ncbi:MAG: hypothetical protein LBH25_10530 [Fibromonadaceae bacterium]|jgi:hypothetical protein|nr:hypothetical protein [Fibromonadaceae bacterium]
MRKIKVKDIEDGMVLQEALKNHAGVVLMSEGTVLRAAFAPRLAQRGISIVCVDGQSDEKNVSAEHLNDGQAVPLEKLFEGKIENNKSMKIIYEALAKHRSSSGT